MQLFPAYMLWKKHTKPFLLLFSFFLITEAAGLIRHLLVINPAKRATINDICRHWWVNLGYDKSPMEDAPLGHPIDFHILERSLTVSSDSDSDPADSPATRSHNSKKQKPLKSILKKPKDEGKGSLKGNHSDSGFYNGVSDWTVCQIVPEEAGKTDPIGQQSSKDSKSSTVKNESVQTRALHKSHQNGSCDPTKEPSSDLYISTQNNQVEPVFDSKRKPKRGILKNKNRYQGADSGCVMDDININEYFDSENLQHLTNNTNGTSGESPSVSETKNSVVTQGAYNEKELVALLDDLTSMDISNNCDLQTNANCDTQPINGELITLPSTTTTTTTATKTAVTTAESQQGKEHQQSTLAPIQIINQSVAEKTGDGSSPDSDGPESFSSSTPRKLKGILKWNGKYTNCSPDPTWRYSIGSQSSNSSGDILDFSYDSGDCENLVGGGGGGETSRIPPLPTSLPPAMLLSDEGCVGDAYDDELTDIYNNLIEEFQTTPLHRNHPHDEVMNKINMLDEAYYEEGIHRKAVTSDMFHLSDVKQVYEGALKICQSFTPEEVRLCLWNREQWWIKYIHLVVNNFAKHKTPFLNC